MKVDIVYFDEDGIEVRINKNNKYINEIVSYINSISDSKIKFYQKNMEVFIPLSEIIFFETEDTKVYAHTKDNTYTVKYKLYELEYLLPKYFIRVSKSSIVNKTKIYSIDKNVTRPGVIKFKNTHKQTYISRMYYKLLKEELI